MVTQSQFIELTNKVIGFVEGGYYHPDMKKKFKPADQKKFGDSGETMFGIDRKHGTQLARLAPDAWKKFWSLIDNAGARTKWKYNYNGGSLAPQLKQYVVQMMYPWFMYLFNKYLTPAAQQAVVNDNRLVVHFSYASWNGEGWFKKFAADVNNAVSRGVVDDPLYNRALSSRLDSSNAVIRQQGSNLKNLIATLDIKKKIDRSRWGSWGRAFDSFVISGPYF